MAEEERGVAVFFWGGSGIRQPAEKTSNLPPPKLSKCFHGLKVFLSLKMKQSGETENALNERRKGRRGGLTFLFPSPFQEEEVLLLCRCSFFPASRSKKALFLIEGGLHFERRHRGTLVLSRAEGCTFFGKSL